MKLMKLAVTSLSFPFFVTFGNIIDLPCPKRETLPVIDIDPIINPSLYNESALNGLKQDIVCASKTWGVFNAINHGIDQNLLNNVKSQMTNFFHAPKALKNTVRRSEDNSRGYADDEFTKQRVDRKEVFDVGVFHTNLSTAATKDQQLDGMSRWPSVEAFPLFRSTVEEYYEEAVRLSWLILKLLVEEIPCSDWKAVAPLFYRHTSLLRLNHYPYVPDTAPTSVLGEIDVEKLSGFGVSRHTDAGVLTVLLQDEHSGLEAYSGSKEDFSDGEWLSVPPLTGALTINTGDMLQVWSNNKYKAVEHRVRATTVESESRFSVPFFYNPDYDALIRPFLCPNPDGSAAPVYKPIRWGDYRSQRFLGDFADVGTEIQIEQFQGTRDSGIGRGSVGEL